METPVGNKGLAQLLVQSVFVRSELLIKFVAGLTVKCFKNRNMCQASIVTGHAKRRHYQQNTNGKRYRQNANASQNKKSCNPTHKPTLAAHFILPNRTQGYPPPDFLTSLQTVDKIFKVYCDQIKKTSYI
jgi:hypothetical protein